MFIIRPATLKDREAILKLSLKAGPGMVALPKNRDLIGEKIKRSEESFNKNIKKPKRELYLFVLEYKGNIGGTCAIYSKIGVKEPLYFFRIEQDMLHAISLVNGPSEIGGLFITSQWRKEGLGEFLSLTRFLFMAQHPKRFDDYVIGRLRGYINRNTKKSPFWDWIGKNFLNIELEKALKKLEKGRGFIENFIPKYPIYISLLPQNIQKIIGQTSTTTKPAQTILMNEGFKIMPDIDIFDAGPILVAKLKNIKTIKTSKTAVYAKTEERLISQKYIITNKSVKNFRACLGSIKFSENKELILDSRTALALNIKIGDSVRFCPMHKTL